MSADAQCCESVHAIAERQELVLRRQLKELHRLVGAQRQLKGADPLTGQLLEAQAGRAKKPGLLDELPPLLDSAGGIASIGCVAGVVDIMRRATAVDSTIRRRPCSRARRIWRREILTVFPSRSPRGRSDHAS